MCVCVRPATAKRNNKGSLREADNIVNTQTPRKEQGGGGGDRARAPVELQRVVNGSAANWRKFVLAIKRAASASGRELDEERILFGIF